MDQFALKNMTHICVMYIKHQRSFKQASEWQNVSDNCAGTDLRARRAEEEHEGYQQRLNNVTLRHVYKSTAYFQAREWQNVSDSCA